eukprot:CAMPEP_0196801816 /NCGR_PEP_ID=MMETSP1362-20130617/1598_1 /TAXON_ID=163516 /ORGANISM="Leptocylindrus danicus, Strain CCMP1856" /LENGTH=43 /DNA_ID= /DNA_START= /DNA_END= /DNA_ORIENTATION=
MVVPSDHASGAWGWHTGSLQSNSGIRLKLMWSGDDDDADDDDW